MRLDLFGPHQLSSFQRTRALTQAELILASRGVLLSDCVEAIAADARKELPNPIHWAAFVDAEQAALNAALGPDANGADLVLGLVVNEDDFVDDVVPKLVAAGLATLFTPRLRAEPQGHPAPEVA